MSAAASFGRRPDDYAAGMSQIEVARELGVTRAAISLTERRALRKLRSALLRLGIDGALAEPINWWGEGER